MTAMDWFWLVAASAASVIAILVWSVVLIETMRHRRSEWRISDEEHERLAAAALQMRREYEMDGRI